MNVDSPSLTFLETIKRLKTNSYQFIDFGSTGTSSLRFCQEHFAVTPGFMLDSRPDKFEIIGSIPFDRASWNEFNGMKLPFKCVPFASMLYFLQQLPNLESILVALEHAAWAAQDFIFIRHSSFEDVEYLARLGLRLGWTAKPDQINPFRIEELQKIFKTMEFESYSVFARNPVPGSRCIEVLPIDAPCNDSEYDHSTHGEKVRLNFDRPVYREFDIFIKCNEQISEVNWQKLCKRVVSSSDEAILVIDKRYSTLFDIFTTIPRSRLQSNPQG
ncbi:MAG: hypothetical protein KDD62_09235 [Bdellovibrionales bacterium]|nr:hypothetical protein [Bdellovibrionales bacterium]